MELGVRVRVRIKVRVKVKVRVRVRVRVKVRVRVWSAGLAHNGPPGGVLRIAQTASSHTPNRKPNWSHSANTARVDRLRAIFYGTKLVRG